MQQPPSDKGRRLKIYYMTQVSVKPPTFVIFVNSKKLMHFSYTRYLENKIREAFGFSGTPIEILCQRKEGKLIMTAYIICLIVGYFCGCISMGYFVGRFYHMDIRTKGSGNAGTTNVLRNLGKIPALITFAGDLVKAIIPILVIRLVFTPEQWYLWCLYCGLGVVLGHNYPFYLGFKGGKALP